MKSIHLKPCSLAAGPGNGANEDRGRSQWGTSTVLKGAASKAEPAAAKARSAHTPPIDIIGGRCLTLYSDGTPSVFEGSPSEAEPAAAKARSAHIPPVDIIGGRYLTLYSDKTPGVFEGAA